MKYPSLSPIISKLKSTTGLLEAALVQIQAGACPDIKGIQGASIEILAAWVDLQGEIEETKRLMVRQTEG